MTIGIVLRVLRSLTGALAGLTFLMPGFHAIENYHRDVFDDPKLRVEVHAALCVEFEGVDFFAPLLATRTNFCKMWIDPFPFTL